MKQMRLPSLLLAVAATALFTSCKPSRVWATKDKKEKYDREERYDPPPPPSPPRSYVSVALVITPSPGFVMNRFPDGRYYHRSPQGILYWKSYDDHFYMDRSYLHKVRYSKWDYDQWRRYSRAK